MRPTPSESLRAIQAAVGERFVPELQTLFAQEAATAVTMLVESLAAEEDTLAEDLRTDNGRLRQILDAARDVLARNTGPASLVSKLDGVLAQAGDGRIAISSLSTENDRLNGALAELLEHIEDTRGDGPDPLDEVRAMAYRQLRRVAVRGWSYLDVAGFRERIVKARAELISE
ncbi:MAG: hypothetical protein ABI559_13630 [Chloroflexota bacterium]